MVNSLYEDFGFIIGYNIHQAENDYLTFSVKFLFFYTTKRF